MLSNHSPLLQDEAAACSARGSTEVAEPAAILDGKQSRSGPSVRLTEVEEEHVSSSGWEGDLIDSLLGVCSAGQLSVQDLDFACLTHPHCTYINCLLTMSGICGCLSMVWEPDVSNFSVSYHQQKHV